MGSKHDNLWQGGAWETANSPVPKERIFRPAPSVRRRRWRRRAILAAAAVLTLLALILGISYLSSLAEEPDEKEYWSYEKGRISNQPPKIDKAEANPNVTVTLKPLGEKERSYQEIYQKNTASMVSIQARDEDDYSTGTGIVLTEDGYLLTNAHVVAGCEEVGVIFRDNQWKLASLVGFDAYEDLAVLKVDAKGLTPAEFGDSNLLQIGDDVAALGDPLGYRATMTDGIISALNRSVTVEGVEMNLIQTSAAINFGNSGGALINRYGQVVGVTTVKIIMQDGSTEALGFAIPSRRVKYVADRLIAGERVQRARFGITVDARSVPGGGLTVLEVDADSDAAAKGISAGDIIRKVDGVDIHSTEDLIQTKQSLGPGDSVTLTIVRDGKTLKVPVLLMLQPD